MLCGYVPSPPDVRDHRFEDSERFAAGPIIGSTDELELRNHISFTPVWSQITTDCCAHAAAEGLYASAAADGFSIAPPSRLFLYAVAQLLEQRGFLSPRGSSLRLMFKGMNGKTFTDSNEQTVGLGAIAEKRWPEIAANVDVVPPDDCFREGENATIRKYSRIPDGSLDGLDAALRRLRAPTVCCLVDEKFRDIGKGVYDGPGGAVFGGHAMLLVAKLGGDYVLRNSWGPELGDGGYVRVTAEFMRTQTREHWVTDVAPEAIS